MERTFTSVDKELLPKAFALAHRASENPEIESNARAKFRAIAFLIWEAHGEAGAPPSEAGKRILEVLSAAADSTPEGAVLKTEFTDEESEAIELDRR